MSRLWILLVPLAFGACGADTTMDITAFDRSCSIAADCALVFANVCGCDCAEVAISAKDAARYEEERSAKFAAHCEQLNCGACGDTKHAECLDKVCTAQ